MCFKDDDARPIFLTAVEDYVPEQWDDFVQKACGEDVALRRRVQCLLAAHQGEDSVLDRDEGTLLGDASQDRSLGEVPDKQIGPYKLLEKLGEGGMGVVYLAEQTEPVERRVALKIIHRDIKPSNVLVALYGDRPIPKVIDFGVAKATRQPLSEETNVTLCGQFVGTLDYMSPEQAGVNPMDIDTRSDIYSLGGLLYELLVGPQSLFA